MARYLSATMVGPALTAGAGVAFGAALTASDVYLPSVIAAQMELRDYHMLIVFFSASASSALVMAAFEWLNIVQRQPRKGSSIGWCGPYDANVLGGLLVGMGMALTGACPGTVLVQLALGIKSGIPTALGGLIGGILYVRLASALKRRLSTSATLHDAKPHTVQTKFDVNPAHVLLAYEVICLMAISVSTIFGLDRSAPFLNPVVGGALIGGAQATSLLLTGNAVGVSTAYEEAGRFFWHFLTPEEETGRPPTRAMTFAVGIFVGSFAWSRLIFHTTAQSTGIPDTRALVGGCMMAFGARLAGGCTSGHGISGMSTFSISSIITVGAIFGGGILTARVFR